MCNLLRFAQKNLILKHFIGKIRLKALLGKEGTYFVLQRSILG